MQKVDKKKKERKGKSFRKEQYTALQNTLHTTITALCVHIEQTTGGWLRKQCSGTPHESMEGTSLLRGVQMAAHCLD